MVFVFKGFTPSLMKYVHNCTNCCIFELNDTTKCPLFIVKPLLPESDEELNLDTEEGLAKFLSIISCVLMCEYHVSKEQAERMNNEPVRKKGRFDTLDLESE